MNERNSVPLVTHRFSRWLLTTALVAVLALLGNSALAQITYSEGFTGCNAATCNGWSIAGGYSALITDQDPFAEGYFPCSPANPAIKSNLYNGDAVTTITSSSLGTSSGALATLSFVYKAEDYPDAAATPAGEAQLAVSYGASAGGPWTLISSFTNPVTAGCIAPPALTFTPPAATPIFIQIVVTNVDPLIDFNGFWIVIDDVTLNQAAGGGCSGNPAPGNTLATVASACSGENFTLSLQNGTAGNDVTYTWQFDNGGGWATFGGSAPTQVASQVGATSYKCIVTCPSSLPGVESTPIAIGMTSQYPVDFAPVTPFPSNCWTATNVTFLTRDAVSAFGNGSGSARWNFYQDGGGIEYSLVSPTIPALPAGYQIKFDAAGAAYIGGEVDHIFLEYSTTGNGGSWTQIAEMTNAPGGVLNTFGGGGTTGALFIPTSGQWTTLSYPVPTGTNAVRFRGVSEWGNEVYIDNINFELIPICFSPSFASLTAAVATTTSANIAWGADGSALTYDVEIRQGGTPGTPGANYTTNTASLSVLANSGLTFGQTYDVYVRSQCGINGTGSWTGPRTLLMDYCLAGANLLGDPVITNFSFAGINQNNASSAGYLNFTAATASVAPGVGSGFTLTRQTPYTNDSLVIWADLNDDLDFNDLGEQIYNAAGLNIGVGSGTITIPNGTPAGNKRMRLRRIAVGVGLGGATPCGIAPFGQVHDYTLNVCAAADASIAVNDAGCLGQFFVNVTTNSFGSGGSATINYSINGVAQSGVPAILAGMVPLGPFTPGQYITVSLNNGTACTLNTGDWWSSCPVTIACPAPVPFTHCYRQNDLRTWTFSNSSPGETNQIAFTQGTIAPGDVVSVYDVDVFNNYTLIGTNSGATDLSTLPPFLGSEPTIHMAITQSTAPTNCVAGTPGYLPWIFNVQCTPGCAATNANLTGGGPVVTCVPGTGNGTYTLTLNVTNFEGSNVPGSTINVIATVAGSPQAPVAIAAGGSNQFGPYALGTTVSLLVDHPNDDICDLTFGPYTPANNCPPVNDECAQAIVIPVLPPGGCLPGGTFYTTTNATYTSSPAATCGITGVSPVLRDVWFSFNTGLSLGPLYIYFDAGTATNLALELYNGTCGALVSAGCFAAAGDLGIFVPIQNQQWYMRVISNSTTGVPGTFKFCITTSTTCGGTSTSGTGNSVTNVTGNSAQYNFVAQGPGTYVVEYGPSTPFINPGIAGTPAPGNQITTTTITTGTAGIAFLSCLNPATGYRVWVRRDCGGGDYSVNGRFRGTTFTTLAAPPPPIPITHATCAQAGAIPDVGPGCTTNNTLNQTFTVSAPGTNLGVDVSLESVDLIVNHLSRSQLRVRLISPTGCERNLVLVRGGTGDNFGNSATCVGVTAASPMKLKDGSPALSTMSTTALNVTGPFSPEQPLSGFTGDPNGTWTIRICDGTVGTAGTLEYVKLNFVTCVGPTATRSVVPACPAGFNVSVNVTNMGSASSYTITNNINGSTVPVPSTGTYSAGPFPSGSNVILTLVHGSDVSCNAVLSAISFICPPANDNCAGAILLTPSATCVNTAGTVAGATLSLPGIAGCDGFTGVADDDVWYKFVATRTQHRITVAGGFDCVIDLRTGPTCDGAPFDCEDMLGSNSETMLATGLTIGTTYFVRVYSWSGTVQATPTFNICVEAPDCLGVYGGPAIPGASCSDGLANTVLDAYNSNCVCTGLTCTTDLKLSYTKDAGSVVTWTVYQQVTNAAVQTGSFLGTAGDVTSGTCVPDGCYYLRVTDNVGDGIGGGYILSLLSGGTRIVDNRNNFLSGTNSQQAGPGFCLPLSADRLIYTSCDKMDWRTNEYIYATDNAAVTAVWNSFAAGTTQRANSGYEMWWFNPNDNAGYTFRRFQSHATTNGLTASATRACGFKINSWSGNQLQTGVLYNVRVRARLYNVALNENQWGAACRFGRDEVRAQCPLTKLMDVAGSPQFSCGASRAIGSGAANLVHARPVTRYLGGVSTAANRYKFRFVTDAGGSTIIKISATGQSWVNTTGLAVCKLYDVDVTCSFDNGVTYCEAYAGTAFGQPYAPKWGEVCTLYTTGPLCPTPPVGGGNQNMAVDGSTNATGLRMYPNPNRGDQVILSLNAVEEGVNTVSVDIYDVFGKRVDARTIAVQDNFLNTTIDLNGALASGMYTVNITAGATTYTERLVIQP